MSDDVDLNTVDQDFETFDESEYNELKINPSYYLHHAMVKSQECLLDPNMESGLMRFQFMTMHLESLCKASNLIKDDYYTSIETYKDSEEYKKALKHHQPVILAIKKQELLTSLIFGNKSITTPLELK